MNTFLDYFLAAPALYTQAFLFYAFSAVLLFSAVMVITVRSSVHAVLFLILAFFNAAGLFLLMGAEFVAMILVIVYVGAVAVFFLFVVMMLDADFTKLSRRLKFYLPVGLLVGAMFASELILLVMSWQIAPDALDHVTSPAPALARFNTQAIGQVLYTDYILPFQLAGIVLLVAMVGAIVLTHRDSPAVRRQKIFGQVERRPADVVKVTSVETGKGVEQ